MGQVTRYDKEGIEQCTNQIKVAINNLIEAANAVDKTMQQLPTYWEGPSYEKANSTYEAEYRPFLTKTVPDSVEKFNQYIEDCKKAIIELDEQMGR